MLPLGLMLQEILQVLTRFRLSVLTSSVSSSLWRLGLVKSRGPSQSSCLYECRFGDVIPLFPLWWRDEEEEEEEDEGSGDRTSGLVPDRLPSRLMGFFMLRSRVPFSSTSMSISCREKEEYSTEGTNHFRFLFIFPPTLLSHTQKVF